MCCLFDLMWLQMDLATVRFSTSHQESNIWCTGGDQSEAKRCSNINQQGNLTQTNTSNSQNTFPSLSLQDLIKSTYEYVAQGPFLTQIYPGIHCPDRWQMFGLCKMKNWTSCHLCTSHPTSIKCSLLSITLWDQTLDSHWCLQASSQWGSFFPNNLHINIYFFNSFKYFSAFAWQMKRSTINIVQIGHHVTTHDDADLFVITL